MSSLNHNATFDCLFIADHLKNQKMGFSKEEVHLFAYLACLLWLYQKRVVNDWGYIFVGTVYGAPFSREIDVSLSALHGASFLRRDQDRFYAIKETVEPQLRNLASLKMNQERVECLRAACSSTMAFSIGMVGSALANEPELSRAREVHLSRPLLEEAAQEQLFEHFKALRNALDQRSTDLRLPAVVWLAALYQTNKCTYGEA